MTRLVRRIAVLLGLLLAVALAAPTTAEASANLYHCSPLGNGYTYACTTITNAPATGVRVWDWSSGTVVTWNNGTTVALYGWAIDTGSSCGVNGDHYVWGVQWYASGFIHFGVLGDWWLATGAVSNWSGYTDSWGTLGNSTHDNGTGSGTCNNFFPTPGNWATP